MTSWTEIMTPLFQNTLTLRRPRVATFTDIIKVATIVIKITSKDSEKVEIIRNYVLKCNLYLHFLI